MCRPLRSASANEGETLQCVSLMKSMIFMDLALEEPGVSMSPLFSHPEVFFVSFV